MLAAVFAYSMKVETKLAQNAKSEEQLLWLGRSGVEFAAGFWRSIRRANPTIR